jgi:hypothetical protein
MLKTKPSSLFRVDEDEVSVGDGGGGAAPTEAQMRLFIAQTLSMDFAYNAPVVVLKFDVAENGNITGVFKDAARPRVFSFTLDGESVVYKPYKPGKMDSLESEEDVQEWEAFSEGYGFRVDAGVGGKKKPQCVKPTAYNCGATCINVQKSCKSSPKNNTSAERMNKLKKIAKDYQKQYDKAIKGGASEDDENVKDLAKKGYAAFGKQLELVQEKGFAKAKKQNPPKKIPLETVADNNAFKKTIAEKLSSLGKNKKGEMSIKELRDSFKGQVSKKAFDRVITSMNSESGPLAHNVSLVEKDPNTSPTGEELKVNEYSWDMPNQKTVKTEKVYDRIKITPRKEPKMSKAMKERSAKMNAEAEKRMKEQIAAGTYINP